MTQQRFPALDIMRGLTLALMILVNTPGSWSFVYAPLEHADWNGVTLADFIFPFFLFIVGAALYFSYASQADVSTAAWHKKILKRTTLLFLAGLFLNIFPFVTPLNEIRVLGVLQRIALAYGIAALIIFHLDVKMRWLVSVAILLGYWGLLQLSSQPYSVEHSLVRQVDVAVLGASHLWQGKGIAFDPEGLLSTLPAVVNVVVGFEVVRILSSGKRSGSVYTTLITAAVLFIAIALCWKMFFPINKSLWTSPFVLLTSGAAIIVLLFLIALEKTPAQAVLNIFTPFGKNPLFIYALSYMLASCLLKFKIANTRYYDLLYLQLSQFLDAYVASFIFALIHVLLFWCIAKYMDKKGIIISL